MPTQNISARLAPAQGLQVDPSVARAIQTVRSNPVEVPRRPDRAILEVPNPFGALQEGASGAAHATRQILEATEQRIQAMLDSPDFQAMLAVLEIAKEMKQAATNMINNGSGEVDERLMAVVNQTLKDVENLQTFAKSMQDSVNRSREALARYT